MVEQPRAARRTAALMSGIMLLITVLGLVFAACAPSEEPPFSIRKPAIPAEQPVAPPPQRSPSPAPTRQMTFMAGYKAQANLPFVAAYVAKNHGLFAEQGLDVDIRHATSGEHLQLLLGGQVHVTTAAAESVLKRIADPGAPIQAIALFGQTGDQAYATLTSENLAHPKSWEGRTVGYKLFPGPEYLAVLNAAGADRSKIKEVSVGFDPRVLLERRVDVYPVFAGNEPYLLRKLGADVTVTRPADFGIATLGLTYITTRDLIANEPELLERYLKATMKALAMVVESPEIGLEAVMTFAPGEDREHQRFLLMTELAEAQNEATKANGLGWMTEAQWKALHDALVQYQAIARPIEPSAAFTDRFLKAVYRQGRLVWP